MPPKPHRKKGKQRQNTSDQHNNETKAAELFKVKKSKESDDLEVITLESDQYGLTIHINIHNHNTNNLANQGGNAGGNQARTGGIAGNENVRQEAANGSQAANNGGENADDNGLADEIGQNGD